MITVTAHETAEWRRMSQAAYNAGMSRVGYVYSVASRPLNGELSTHRYDELQSGYRAWLVFGEWPVVE